MKIKILFISIILSLLFINAKAAENSILDVKDNDFYIGEENAPITIIEYASMSCSHCADFHNDTLAELKKEFIDTGKVKFIFRDFPFQLSSSCWKYDFKMCPRRCKIRLYEWTL